MLCVQTPAASPYTTSFPIARASSSSRNGMTDNTGPNTSSCAIRIALFTLPKIVGSTNQPSPHSAADAQRGRPLRFCDVDVIQHLLELRLVGDGADLCIELHRIAHLRRPRERE